MAQRWIGPYKGVFDEHGTVIQLMGTADDVVVPRPADYYKAIVALTPPGGGIVQFDQNVGNNETFMFLSTSPPEFDPILGLNSMGTSFFQHLIGVNRMPLGKTTVIGVPDKPLYAFFFAADNSPGFATVEVPVSDAGLVRIPPEPFVAGWSDGRKTPPPNIAKLMEFMDAHSLTPDQLLRQFSELSNANFVDRGANVNSVNAKQGSEFFGVTPLLMNALMKDDCAKLLKLLLDAGADTTWPTKPACRYCRRTWPGRSRLQKAPLPELPRYSGSEGLSTVERLRSC